MSAGMVAAAVVLYLVNVLARRVDTGASDFKRMARRCRGRAA
jgi:biopolymer transport protein ExbB/TolQ